ncbi:MAG: hypothetical protein JO273_04900 [Methylobacteriaceae bacterium]|nr:hypothetical protein [Methylobacteriaceae bacterium]
MRLRCLAIVAAGLLAGGAAISLIHSLAAVQATRRIEAALAALPHAHAASVTLDPWSGRIAIAGLSVRHGASRLHIGKITLDAVTAPSALIAPALARTGSAEAEDVEVEIGPAKIRLPRIEAYGTSLSDSDLAAVIDPRSAMSALERLDKVAAASIIIPRLTIDFAANDIAGREEYRNIAIIDVGAGKLGAFAVASGSLNVSARGLRAPIEGTMGALVVKDLDLKLWARIASGVREDVGEPPKALLEELAFDGLWIRSGDQFELSVGRTTARRIRGRPLLMAIAQLREAEPTPEFLSDLLNTPAIGSVEVRDFALKGPDKTSLISFARFSLAGLANSKLREAELESFSVEFPDGRFKLASVAVHGVNFAPVLGLMTDVPPRAGGTEARDRIPTIDQIVVANLDAEVPAFPWGNAGGGTRGKFRLGRFEFMGSNYLHGIPGAIAATLDDLAFPVEPNNRNTSLLAALGYSKVELSAKLEARWNEPADEISLGQMSVKSAGMGAAMLKGRLAEVGKEAFAVDPQSAVLRALLKEVDVRIDNTGLFEKVIALDAKRTNRSPDQKRGEYISAVAIAVPQLIGNVPVANAIVDAAAQFIAQPGSLRMTAKSIEGIRIEDLQAADRRGAALGELDVTVAANE